MSTLFIKSLPNNHGGLRQLIFLYKKINELVEGIL